METKHRKLGDRNQERGDKRNTNNDRQEFLATGRKPWPISP
jgi:hypothetical protein